MEKIFQSDKRRKIAFKSKFDGYNEKANFYFLFNSKIETQFFIYFYFFNMYKILKMKVK